MLVLECYQNVIVFCTYVSKTLSLLSLAILRTRAHAHKTAKTHVPVPEYRVRVCAVRCVGQLYNSIFYLVTLTLITLLTKTKCHLRVAYVM